MSGFWALVARDMKLAGRLGGGPFVGLGFFIIVVTMVPFGVGADLPLLGRIGPGILWVAVLLATLLSLDRLFQADYEDGSLDLFLMAPLPVEALVLAKCLAHWLTNTVPLIIAMPAVAFLVNLNMDGLGPLVVSLVIGTPALSLIGALGAALVVGVRRGGLVLSLIVLPLYVPVLIFGAAASGSGLGDTPMLFLGAFSLAALALAPFAAAAGLRISVS
ncbi:heme exporter protein CcmB [Pyruvatibacter mobilis]|jgi:heme exporter protein B|uniref:Heme exporter protein B n=1 Tax=Pyruvatibacter mobilis TaxID=1712261 RepID=A0A845Q716_9HYPH|nr:heme exporter protein CcmB [Pyruvatibacter mobilis]NBG94215.1 heme exporter protein CcmB [Pyruvatibacter mobilis]QJD76517.1 heme exporter protein CcmB [Pyruvatibacter mobilis]GGD01264.1 heme exporter protein B [Pyruvatibacter mobilis]